MKRRTRLTILLVLVLACAASAPAYAQGGYVVRPGDTLISIAARHGLTATQLATANGLRWNAWVYAGQRLTIPGAGSAAATSSATATQGGTYVVRAGDTLIGIAARHGISVSQLAAANSLRTNAWVYVGQRLRIPGAGSSSGTPAPSTPSSSGGAYIVRPGDTLISIAARHRITLRQLATANGLSLNSWVYVGQQLKIPGSGSSPSAPAPSTPSSSGSTYVVRPGDTLIRIATSHGVSVSQLAAINGLRTNSWVYVGQRLAIPGSSGSQQSPAPSQGASGEKWIDVNLSAQTLTAYVGQEAAFQTRVSTGTWRTPTVVGTFRIYAKYASTHMSGPGYSLPNVPHTMYFYRGYALHGTYWHNNFGTPMSHGCVNLSMPDAQWLYGWAPMGTKVVTHY